MILERVKPAEPAKRDPDAFYADPSRPGGTISGDGKRLGRLGTMPPAPVDPWKGLVPVPVKP